MRREEPRKETTTRRNVTQGPVLRVTCVPNPPSHLPICLSSVELDVITVRVSHVDSSPATFHCFAPLSAAVPPSLCPYKIVPAKECGCAVLFPLAVGEGGAGLGRAGQCIHLLPKQRSTTCFHTVLKKRISFAISILELLRLKAAKIAGCAAKQTAHGNFWGGMALATRASWSPWVREYPD